MKKNQLHPRTEIINSKQKIHCHEARLKALNWLAKKFPKAFDTTQSIHPLKKGIMDDILQFAEDAKNEGISKSKLRQAVVVFTRRIDYLACLKAQEYRIDLNGEFCEIVTKEEAELATQKIKKRVEKSIKNQKKAQEPLNSKSSLPHYDYRPHFLEREPASKKIEIVFKSKAIKNIDPEAVTRLKSKLGLVRKTEEV